MSSQQQRRKLRDALIDAFPDKSSLEQLLYFKLDKNLNEITGDSSLEVIVFELIKRAVSEGWLLDLVRAAQDERPGNEVVQAIAEEILLNEATTSLTVNKDIQKEPFFPSSNISTKPSTQQQKILLLAALPQSLRLDKQIRVVEEAINRAVKRDSFEIKIRTAVRPQDIRRAIAEERPQIVHFCGHGIEDGSLVLEDDGDNHLPVSPTGLAALFKLHTDYVKCVLLNTCYSALPAEAISKHINYVVGMNQPISDRAAIVFAQGFYDGLGYDNVNNQDVITRAFDEGIVAIQLENLLQGAIPSLWKLGIAQRKIESINRNDDGSSSRDEQLDQRQSPLPISNSDDDLSSLKGVDYTRLRDLLKAGNWKDADYETYLVMLKVVGRKDGDWIRDEELLNFPCTDLRTIDSLWVNYSSGRFGFSVQKKIYLEVGGKPDGEYHEEAWKKFGDRVGWRKGWWTNKEWISYSEIAFGTSAPWGHLPTKSVCRSTTCGWCLLSHRDL